MLVTHDELIVSLLKHRIHLFYWPHFSYTNMSAHITKFTSVISERSIFGHHVQLLYAVQADVCSSADL